MPHNPAQWATAHHLRRRSLVDRVLRWLDRLIPGGKR